MLARGTTLKVSHLKKALAKESEVSIATEETELCTWLAAHGIGKYATPLIDGGCTTLEIFKDIEENDLEEIGIPKMARRTILRHAMELKSNGIKIEEKAPTIEKNSKKEASQCKQV